MFRRRSFSRALSSVCHLDLVYANVQKGRNKKGRNSREVFKGAFFLVYSATAPLSRPSPFSSQKHLARSPGQEK